jgi:hypothetical protein
MVQSAVTANVYTRKSFSFIAFYVMLTLLKPFGFLFSPQLVTGIQRHIDDGPHMIGHPTSPNAQEVKEWHHNLLKCCRCEQLVAGTKR